MVSSCLPEYLYIQRRGESQRLLYFNLSQLLEYFAAEELHCPSDIKIRFILTMYYNHVKNFASAF